MYIINACQANIPFTFNFICSPFIIRYLRSDHINDVTGQKRADTGRLLQCCTDRLPVKESGSKVIASPRRVDGLPPSAGTATTCPLLPTRAPSFPKVTKEISTCSERASPLRVLSTR